MAPVKRQNLPVHVGVIMDGNGRWARQRKLSRIAGHRQGAETLDALLDNLLGYGIPYVSLYAFSTENWGRPASEIRGLFALLREFIRTKSAKIIQENIRVLISGDISRLPADLREDILELTRKTGRFRRLTTNFCLSYGGREEIIRAMNRWKAQGFPDLTEKKLVSYLDHKLPDLDLIIRTSGEQRLSNFMLIQAAYAEFYFTQTLWPDFSPEHLDQALAEFGRRKRRYGKTGDRDE